MERSPKSSTRSISVPRRPTDARDPPRWNFLPAEHAWPASDGANAYTGRLQRTPQPANSQPGSGTTRSSAQRTRITEIGQWNGRSEDALPFVGIRLLRERRQPSRRAIQIPRCRQVFLACLRGGPLFAHHLESLEVELESFPTKFGTGDHLLDVREYVRVTSLFSQFFEKRMNLREYQKHFPTHRGLKEQLLVERPLQHKGCGHAPVSAYLAQPIVFLRAHGKGNFQEIVGALRPEFADPPVPGLAHFGFAAQIIELKNEL